VKGKVLVISHQHHLLPVAWRLQGEGYEVQVAQVFANKRRRRAWEGRFSSFLDGVKIDQKSAEAVVEAATEAGATVLTNSTRWTENFAGYGRLYGVHNAEKPTNSERLKVGFWCGTGKRTPEGEHLVFYDYGAWSGGMGPEVASACTLAHVPTPFAGLAEYVARLRPAGFNGLCAVSLGQTGEPGHIEWGWPQLHTQVWMGGCLTCYRAQTTVLTTSLAS